jgi:hypothetical protein
MTVPSESILIIIINSKRGCDGIIKNDAYGQIQQVSDNYNFSLTTIIFPG